MGKKSSNFNSKFKKSKEIQKLRRKQIDDDLQAKVDDFQSDFIHKEMNFKYSKKLRWYDYLIALSISAFYIILAFIIDKFIINNNKSYFEMLITFGFAISLAIYLISGFLRNRRTSKYFNDRRKRYETTLDPEEGISRRISKIILIITLILLITSIICLIIYFS